MITRTFLVEVKVDEENICNLDWNVPINYDTPNALIDSIVETTLTSISNLEEDGQQTRVIGEIKQHKKPTRYKNRWKNNPCQQ